ncbi:NUDIX hydrolase [Acrocarpospora catenulata]|uniref:NUDIX hydrolase n=1 Tax=Acrocarpospora catenulata TaxID=2836182 RepID=UPI001BD9EEA6|nr:NUDIX domain-containing protein [Acrocarpospora catenulata]
MGAIITDPQDRLLLIKRGHPPGEGLWSIPGGRVEPGETDAEALRREIHEETGLHITPGPLAGTVHRPPYEIHDYYATITHGTPAPGDDATALHWATPTDLTHLPLTDGLLDFLNNLPSRGN